jgi:hypothetical protein
MTYNKTGPKTEPFGTQLQIHHQIEILSYSKTHLLHVSDAGVRLYT